MSATGPKKWGLRLVLAVVSASFAFIALELGYRVYHFGWEALSPKQMRSVHPLGQSGLVRASSLLRPRFELKPGLRSHFKMRPFDTNSHGMRDEECPLEKPPGTFRIAFVGDSWTMGSGVAIEDVFHSVIEAQLAGRGGARTFECLNFGVGGYGLWDYVGTIEHKVVDFDPDLVLVCLSGNDKTHEKRVQPAFVEKPERNYFLALNLIENLKRAMTKKALPMTREEYQAAARVRRKAEAEKARKAARAARVVQSSDDAPDETPVVAEPVPEAEERAPGPLGPAMMRHLHDSFAELGRVQQEIGTPILVVNISGALAPHEGRASKAFALVSEENGLEYWHAGAAFVGYDQRDFWIFRNDQHPNAECNRILGETVLEYLDEGGFLP